jgi:hypothetical protein
VYHNRAVPDGTQSASDGSTIGDTSPGSTQPLSTGGSPPGVIVPPIITGGDSGGADLLASVFGGAFTDFTNLLGIVVTGDQQNLNSLINNQGATTGALIDLMAGGGVAPQPVSQQPPPVNVVVQTPPAPTQATPQVATCPAAFGQYNPARGPVGPKSCFKDCGHEECHNGKKSREHAHCYQNGERQVTSWEVIGGKC